MGTISRYEAARRRPLLRADGADREGEARAAVLSAAALYVVGASLTGTAALLPDVGSATGVKLIQNPLVRSFLRTALESQLKKRFSR